MAAQPLGRTNHVFPSVWLKLLVAAQADTAGVATKAIASGAPLDISTQPVLWGSYLRGADNPLLARSSFDVETATDQRHAADLTEAHLIQTLSALSRETIDIYLLRVRRALEEHQINGALEALESAKQDGHIRFLGLSSEGPALATLGMWQFHDAFDLLLTRTEDAQTLEPLANERRVGVVHADACPQTGAIVLVGVSSPADVVQAVLR